MIKMIYEQKAYEYELVGGQPYDINTEIKVKEDATITQATVAFIKLLKVAQYRVSKEVMIKAINEYFDDDFYI